MEGPRSGPMFPRDARLRNLTYAATLYGAINIQERVKRVNEEVRGLAGARRATAAALQECGWWSQQTMRGRRVLRGSFNRFADGLGGVGGGEQRGGGGGSADAAGAGPAGPAGRVMLARAGQDPHDAQVVRVVPPDHPQLGRRAHGQGRVPLRCWGLLRCQWVREGPHRAGEGCYRQREPRGTRAGCVCARHGGSRCGRGVPARPRPTPAHSSWPNS